MSLSLAFTFKLIFNLYRSDEFRPASAFSPHSHFPIPTLFMPQGSRRSHAPRLPPRQAVDHPQRHQHRGGAGRPVGGAGPAPQASSACPSLQSSLHWLRDSSDPCSRLGPKGRKYVPQDISLCHPRWRSLCCPRSASDKIRNLTLW